MTTTARERPYTTKHQLAHLRRALLASRQEVAQLRAAAATRPDDRDRIEQALRVELSAANAAIVALKALRTNLRERNERQRAALETINRLAQARDVDWPALLAALREGLRG